MSDEKEAVVKDSKVFDIDGELRDAWGRPAEEDEAVDLTESPHQSSTVPELKAELKKREEAGRTFDKSQIKTKRDLVAALDADDKAQEAENATGDDDPDADDKE